MSDFYVLKEYYVRYLRDVRGVKDSTVKHYIDALNYISKYLVEADKIEESVYEIADIGQLEVIRRYLKEDEAFSDMDRRGHQMYSAGLNNYYKFASGEGFTGLKEEIKLLDVEMPAANIIKTETSTYRRSSIIKAQAIQSADYMCEIDAGHNTFLAKASGHQYMEGHHAIPMRKQGEFKNSLDVYANVVCLCPICHRLLHYGMDSDKEVLIDKIYYDRSERLVNSGIKLSREEFETMAI